MKNLAFALAALSLFLPAAHAADDFRPFGIQLDAPSTELEGRRLSDKLIALNSVPTPNPLLTNGYMAYINADGIVCEVQGSFVGSVSQAIDVLETLHAALAEKYPTLSPIERLWDYPTSNESAAYLRGEIFYHASATEGLPYPLTKVQLVSNGTKSGPATWISYMSTTPCETPAENPARATPSTGL